MTNNYEKSEAIELGKAHKEIGDQKRFDPQPVDNLGVSLRSDAPRLDDFDE